MRPKQRVSLIAQLVKKKICLQCRRPQSNSWVRKICWRRDRLPTPVFLGFPGGSAGKESTCNEGDLGSIPGLGRSPGEGKGYPLQCSCLENFMDFISIGSPRVTKTNKQKKEKSKLGSNLDKRNKYKYLVKGLILTGVM